MHAARRRIPRPPDDRAALVAQHGPLVWGLCRRLCPDPEDAYQEVWARVFAALPRFDADGPASLRTWIATVTHRHLVDRHRRRTVRGEVVALGELSAPLQPDPVERRRDQERLEQALQRLPEAQRRVVVMHHLHDQPVDDIAAAEGIAVGTVKSRLHRARARLLELLGGSR
ncbi:MAG: sigma-70 family RNA polymerase sigma factor [Myxococcota bacterium]